MAMDTTSGEIRQEVIGVGSEGCMHFMEAKMMT